jgi:hypothetical protein
VLKDNVDGTFTVSVRAPLQAPHGADTLCRQFETGGGRAAAAGINRLPASRLEEFITALRGWSSTCMLAATASMQAAPVR